MFQQHYEKAGKKSHKHSHRAYRIE